MVVLVQISNPIQTKLEPKLLRNRERQWNHHNVTTLRWRIEPYVLAKNGATVSSELKRTHDADD